MSVEGDHKVGSSHEVLVGIYNHLGDLRAHSADLKARVANLEKSHRESDVVLGEIKQDVNKLQKTSSSHALKWGILTFVITTTIVGIGPYLIGAAWGFM